MADSILPQAPSLEGLRDQIDELDRQMLELLSQRMGVVTTLAAHKREHGLRVRDLARERDLLSNRRELATQLGLPAEIVESLFRLIIWASRDLQASLRAEVPLHMEPKRIAVVGGLGGIGKRMTQLFKELGHHVVVSDLTTELTAEEAAAASDVTMVCVPISVTNEVIGRVGPHVPEDGLLMDVTSVKQAPVCAMLASTKASVLGTHPMFGPAVHSLQGQRIVLCPGRGESWAEWARVVFRARGLIITEAAPEEHDRAMAWVQVLTHFQTQVLGLTLARLGPPLAESLRFTSPAYLMELYVAARHFGQDPALYGPIEMTNPLTDRVTQTFREAAEVLGRILATRDQTAFSAVFDEVRAFFGDFAAEATEQSKFMMDRLVERS